MRSNYMFTKGSIVFATYPESSDMAYLNGRPLVVVSNPTHILNKLMVCTCTTRDKPGIRVSFYDYKNRRYLGNRENSTILPYNILTINAYDITSSIGQLDPFIMAEVDRSIDFHLGRTTEVPGYLKVYDEEISKVNHANINSKYFKQQMPSALYDSHEYARESTNHNSTRNCSTSTEFVMTADYIEQWSDEHPSSDIDLISICRNPKMLMSAIDETSAALIISRSVTVASIAKKYNLNQRNANFLRIATTHVAMSAALNILNNNLVIDKEPADFILIGMALLKAFAPERIDITRCADYDDAIDKIVVKYKIDTENGKIWKNTQNLFIE